MAAGVDGRSCVRGETCPVTGSATGAGAVAADTSLSVVIAWSTRDAGVIRLPSGRLVRGRALRRPLSDGILPEFGIYLLGKRPQQMVWDARWVRWPDLWLPADRRDAQDALREGWSRARAERVEIACGRGRGRTGTALACLAVLDGVPADDAVAYVRKHYDPRAGETPWQRYYVTRFPAL